MKNNKQSILKNLSIFVCTFLDAVRHMLFVLSGNSTLLKGVRVLGDLLYEALSSITFKNLK